jgi:hypothetical protein
MAAGLGFKDFVTGEVLTAADVDGYLMQGVWVFASAAARDAAVTSPQEGNFAYLKDTNVTTYYTGSAWANLDTTGMTNPMTTTGDIIYSSPGSTPVRLGIGTAGQVLKVNSGATAPEWGAAGGASGLTLIERATFSSTTSIISGSVFSATYENYLILITVNSMTNAPAFEMRMRTGSTTTTSGYTFAQANATTSSTAAQYAASNTSAWDLTSGDTTNGTFIRMHMANPYASQFTHFNAQNDWTQSSTTMQVRNQAGFLNNTTSYDKFDIAAQYNVTGQYAVYGFAI